jgi:hypothetical protein
MSVKIMLLVGLYWIISGCSQTKIYIDTNSVSEISEQNAEIKETKTSVYLKNGIELIEGDFEIVSDSLNHKIDGEVDKYPLSRVESLKTVKDHSSTTIIGLSLIAGGVIIFDSFKEDHEFREMPNTNDVRVDRENESRSDFLSDRLKGNLFGSALSISGLIVLVTGVRNATKTYYFR